MPDYSLQRNSPPPQSHQQTQNHISILSSVSQQAKIETENALLREALAMSAQNYEALTKQLIESQNRFNIDISKQIAWLQNQSENTKYTIFTDMEEIKKILLQSEKNQQARIANLQSMNDTFSKSLNDVLIRTSVKLTAQVKKDVDAAMKANIQAIDKTVQRMEQTAAKVTDFENKLKSNLDKRIKAYNYSIQRLFKLNGWRELLFWAGMAGGILTPIVLIIGYFL